MKTIIEVNNRRKSRNAEHYQLYSSFQSIISEGFATKYKLVEPRNRFVASFAKENDAYLQNQAYEGTKLIDEKNEVCDRRYRAFDLAVQSKQLADAPNEVAAAERIIFLMTPYKGAPQKPHAENIAMVKDLVEQLESDKYAADIETLGLTAQVASLKSSVMEFETALSNRAGERLARIAADNMKAIRPVVEQDFADLATLISASYLMNTYIEVNTVRAAEIEVVIDAVNAEIVRFQDTLARRGIGSASQPGKDEETPKEDDDKPVVV